MFSLNIVLKSEIQTCFYFLMQSGYTEVAVYSDILDLGIPIYSMSEAYQTFY